MQLRDEWPMVHIRRRGRIYVVGYSFAELPRSLSPHVRDNQIPWRYTTWGSRSTNLRVSRARTLRRSPSPGLKLLALWCQMNDKENCPRNDVYHCMVGLRKQMTSTGASKFHMAPIAMDLIRSNCGGSKNSRGRDSLTSYGPSLGLAVYGNSGARATAGKLGGRKAG